MSFRTSSTSAFRISGTGCCFGGWNAQNCRPFSMSTPYLLAVTAALLAARVGRAHLHPRLEVGDHVRPAACAFGGIAVSGFLWRSAWMSRLLLAVAGHDGRAVLAALADAVAGVEQEPALDLLRFGRVALVALLHQHRANLLLEERDLLLRRLVVEANARRRGPGAWIGLFLPALLLAGQIGDALELIGGEMLVAIRVEPLEERFTSSGLSLSLAFRETRARNSSKESLPSLLPSPSLKSAAGLGG